jgi:hypothetical protein
MFKVIKLKLEIQDRDRGEVKPVPALCGIVLSGQLSICKPKGYKGPFRVPIILYKAYIYAT